MSKKKDTPSLPEKGCHNCRFWKERAEDGDDERNGECRCGPPAALYDPDEGAFSLWPFTAAKDWCGAFQPTLQ